MTLSCSAFRRQVEGIVLALFGFAPQFDVALGRGLGVELEQLLGARRIAAAVGRRGQRSAGDGSEVALAAAGGEREREQQGGRGASHQAPPSASRASAIRWRTWSGAVPPWLARAATEASTESARNTPSPIRPSIAWRSVSGSASSATPRLSASFTAAPVI